jgi:hypothetical protein
MSRWLYLGACCNLGGKSRSEDVNTKRHDGHNAYETLPFSFVYSYSILIRLVHKGLIQNQN